VQGTVTIPGFHGGATWAGASFDPASAAVRQHEQRPVRAGLKRRDDGSYEGVGYSYFLDPDGYPAIKPPWGC
jgi:quinoprotein glucose dehydrogenase